MAIAFAKNETGFSSYFRFQHKVTQETRYLRGPDIKHFLDAVRATSSSRKRMLSKDRILWRAQLGYDLQPVRVDAAKVLQAGSGSVEIKVPAPYGCDRMTPQVKFAREGRVNPKGIPCLYLADDPHIAMAEMRPWLGSWVSLAQFRVRSDAVVIDCSLDDGSGERSQDDEGSDDPAERERAVWNEIAEAFSEPVTQNDTDADYVPTQILAELFRNEGFAGIGYKSMVGKGRNVAMFRLGAAEFVTCGLYSITSISYGFEQSGKAVQDFLRVIGSDSTK